MTGRPGPELVGIEITRRCNLTCQHCYTAAAAANRTPPEFTHAELRRLIDELAALGTRGIGWTGGEPLLRDDLEELMAYAREQHGIESGVTTNGVLLDARRVDRLARVQTRVVQVSLDGSTPERNARLRGATAGEFEQAIAGIQLCLERGLRVHLALVLGAENLEDAPAYLELAARLGVESVRCCGFVPTGRGRRTAIARRMHFDGAGLDRLREFVRSVEEREHPVVLFDPAFGPLPPDYPFHECMAGSGTCYLSATGAVYPCTSLLHRRFIVGNLRERSLKELWEDPRMTEIARLDPGSIEGHCSSCPYLPGCHGGCRGIAYAHTGRLRGSLPVCLKLGDAEVSQAGSGPAS